MIGYDQLHVVLQHREAELEALRREVEEWRNGERQYPPAVQDYKDMVAHLNEQNATQRIEMSDALTARYDWLVGKVCAHDDTALKQAGAKLLRDTAKHVRDYDARKILERMADELEGKK